MWVCLGVSCVWKRHMRRRSSQDHCNQHESLLLPGSTYLKYGHPLLVMTLIYHFYNKLVVGIIIMISKQTFLF